MAVTRSFLKSMNLNDEQISAIIEEHTTTINGLKEARDKYKEEAERLAGVEKELENIKGGDDWKSKYDELKKEFDNYKAEIKNEQTISKVRSAYSKLLKDASIDEKRIDAILRITDLSKMKLDENGNLIDADKISDKIRDEWSAFVTKTSTKGAGVETPPDGHSTKLTRADIYAKDEHGRYKMSTADRQKALMDNPDLMKG